MAPQSADRLAVLHACEHLVAEALDVPDVLQRLVDGGRQLLDAPASWLATIDREDLRIAAHSGLRSPDMPARWHIKVGQGVGGAVAATSQPALIRDYRRDPRRARHVKLIIDAENLRSGAVVPVPAQTGGLVGVLYVADHLPGRITADDMDLLAIFARAGAAAVGRAARRAAICRESEAHARSAADLRRCLLLVRRFSDLLLADADVRQALSLLAAELNAEVELRDPLGRVVASAGATTAPVGAEHVLAASGVRLGSLIVRTNHDLAEPGAQVLAAASDVLALQLSRQRERYETEQRLHRQFLIDLLRPGADRRELTARASLLGLDLESPRAVCCVGIHLGPKAQPGRPPVLTRRALEAVEDTAGRRFPGSIVILHGAVAVVLVPQTGRGREVVLEGLRAALTEAAAMLTGMALSAGLGAPCLTLDDYASSYQDAALALELARTRPGGGVVLAHEQLGIYGMLARSVDPEGLRSCVLPVLAPLLASDEQRGTDHLRTLRVYLAHDRHLQQTAGALHLHVNSLRYRLQRIERLVGMNLHDADDLFHLELAVRIAGALHLAPDHEAAQPG